MPELTQVATDLPRSAAPVGPAEYQRVIARARDEVARTVPPGSIVLVVSRGDEELVRFPNHRGWHFPRAAGGEYGGYHPEDSHAVIAHLDELRAAGAAFLVFPRTAFWWLDYYGELAGYLETGARRIVDERDACLIFAFEGGPAGSRVAPASKATGGATPSAGGRLEGLIEALLPEECSVAIAVSDYKPLPTLGERGVWRIVLPGPAWERDTGVGADLAGQLEALTAAGVAYLVVPWDTDGLIRFNPAFRYHMEMSCRVVTRQRYIGAIYMLDASSLTPENGGQERREREERWP
ncbi:MAG: hypothetical protein ACREK5_06600 [Gemmatimonadota bacterium]